MRGPKIEDYEAELEDLERKWSDIQKNLERSAGLEEHIAELEEGIEAVNTRLMQVEDVAVNSEFFYDLEEEIGIALGRFSQGEAVDGSGLHLGTGKLLHFSAIPFNLTMSGTMDEILSFIDLMDRQAYILRLDSLRLAPQSGAGEKSQELTGLLRCHILAAKHE